MQELQSEVSEKNPCFVINLRREHKIYFREWEEVIKDNNKKMKNYLDFYKIANGNSQRTCRDLNKIILTR